MEATGPSEYQRNYRPWVVRGGGAPPASVAPERAHRMTDRTTLRPRPPGPVTWVHDETMAHALDAARNHAEHARRYKENATGGAMAVAGVSRDASPTRGAAAAHARATAEATTTGDAAPSQSPDGSPTRPAFKAPTFTKAKESGSPTKAGSPKSTPLAAPPTTTKSASENVPSSDVPTCRWKPGPVPKQYHTVYHKEYQGTPGPQYKPQWVNSHQRNFESPTCVPLPARESSPPKPGHASSSSSGGRPRARSVSPSASRDPDATRPTPTLYETRIGTHTAPTVYHMPAGVARQLMQGRLGAPQPSPPGYMLPNIFGESAPERTPRAPSPPPKNMAITPAAGLTSNESALVFTGSSLPPRRRAGAKPAVIDAEGTLPMPVPGLLSDQVDHTWTALGSGAAKGSSPPARNEASRTPSPTRCVKTLPAI
ncbi:hypothetical protein AMAG_09437 [Allomyces macrogynus ATCC 38327]|uniref:Uncharacterized protein n=1 Tax=Allomyces macrogynus (strain ATCC 38327) TaxID=578462 RepID=A0A0L0SPT0_ALLM3|nr:hypothetical protein AMAG_09437 [Allomyces macrogynus ATCC 38327]|eukprot:KNE64414.1 hypothetical protein AMAG_09437 [Allomyces macrogynus ATCC 38327]